MKTSSSLNIFVVTLLIATGFAIYSNTFSVPFYFDDSHNVQNPVIQINEISFDNLTEILTESALKTRPVSNITFALNHFFGGERVQGYHLVNILIHIISAIAVFFLLKETLSIVADKRIKNNTFSIALLSSLLWLSHPVATQSVTYIVQRMNSMAAMFYLVSILFYVLGRKLQLESIKQNGNHLSIYGFYLLSVITGFLALGSKEISATLPIAIILYEWYFFQNLRTLWFKKKLPYISATIALFVAIAIIYTSGNIAGAIFDGYAGRNFSLEERLLTQLRVIVHYLSIIIYPSPDRLFLDHAFPISKSLLQPITTLLAGIFIFAIFLAAIAFAQKERLLSFCIIFFFLNLTIESSFIPLEIIYEHRTYLPAVFLIFFLVIIAYRFFYISIVVSISLLVISTTFSFWTYQRNFLWGNPVAFWNESIQKYPDDARTHTNLGVAYFRTGELSQAKHHFEIALKLKPANALVLNNLAEIDEKFGNYSSAEELLIKAIDVTPTHILARLNLAMLYKRTGRLEESLKQYRYIHNLYPDFSTPNIQIGQLLLKLDKPQEALEYLLMALPKKPDNLSLNMGIAETYMRLGKLKLSIDYYNKSLELDPNQVIALFNLGLLYSTIGDNNKAINSFTKAYLIQPKFVPVAFNYGNNLLREGRIDDAQKAYKAFLSQESLMADAHNNMGLIFIHQNDSEQAIIHFERALSINPNHKLASRNAELARESSSQVLQQ